MRTYIYLLITSLNCVLGISQIQSIIPFVNDNTLNIKTIYTGKPAYYSLFNAENLFKSLPLYNQLHFGNILIEYPNKDSKNKNDIAMSEISSETTDNKNITEKVYLLVVNYKSQNPIIYLSRSNVFNFKEEDKIIDKDIKYVMFKIKTKNGFIEYIIDLNKKRLKNSNLTLSSDTLTIINEIFFIPIWENYIKYGEINYNGKLLKIALIDENNNGLFNEKNKDLIAIKSNINNNICFDFTENSSSKKVSIINVIKLTDSTCFNIEYIDPLGNFLLLNKNKFTDTNEYIKIFEKIPNEKFLSSDSSYTTLNSFCNTGKYLYVNILTEFCPPCIKKIPKIDSLSMKYQYKLNILNLLDQANYSDLKRIIKKYQIKSKYGLSNKSINYELHLAGYPFGVLFAKDGSFIKEIRFINELEEFLNKNE